MDYTYENMEINDIVALAQNGNDEAMTYILESYKYLVLRFARHYYLSDGDAQDAIQEGMIGLYKAVRDFKQVGTSFICFASICIKRQIITAVKKSTRQYNLPLNCSVSLDKPTYDDNRDSMMSTIVSTDLDPESDLIQKERIDYIKTQLAARCTAFEFGVLLDYLDGYCYKDIAERWKHSIKAVDNALTRVKGKTTRITLNLDLPQNPVKEGRRKKNNE